MMTRGDSRRLSAVEDGGRVAGEGLLVNLSTEDTPVAVSAAVRAERTMARAVAFFRAGGLAELLLAGVLDFGRDPYPALTMGLVVLVFVESGALIVACLRIGAVRPSWAAADVVFSTAALVACALLTAPRDFHTWANFMYPFSLLVSVAIGVAFRRLATGLVLTTILAAAYATTAVLLRGEPAWNVLPNGLTYYPNMVVAWAVTRHLLVNGRETDHSRAEAVEHAGRLAKEMERARHARVLHDRVLQTLETLATGSWLSDPDFRTHIATEATWLRSFIEGSGVAEERDLLVGLQHLVQRNARIGLRVELNSTRLRDAHALRAALGPELVDAVVDATREALANTVKHAGVDTAVVRVGATTDELTVSVLDQGCGFDLELVALGTGIEHSIRSRIAEQGGVVHIDSAPGAGTYVEITVPLSGGRGAFCGRDRPAPHR